MINFLSAKGMILFIPLVLIQITSYTQVTISPEIGLSFRPHTIAGDLEEKNAKTPNLLMGISGSFPLVDKVSMDLGIYYSNRENQTIYDHRTAVPDGGDFYSQQDLSLDLSGILIINPKFRFGIGGTLIRKINTYLETSNNIFVPRVHYDLTQNLYGAHFLLKYSTKFIDIKFRCTRLFDNEIIGIGDNKNNIILNVDNGLMRYDLFIGVPFTSKKNKP